MNANFITKLTKVKGNCKWLMVNVGLWQSQELQELIIFNHQIYQLLTISYQLFRNKLINFPK